MVNRLQSWVFILIALICMAWGLIPIVRVMLGLDQQFIGSYIWSISFLIAGVMCGLTGMLLMVRRQPDLLHRSPSHHNIHTQRRTAVMMHASGLLLYTGLPLLNFLLCYLLWIRHRHVSEYLDYQGREAICFQITLYLYLLMCLFMAVIAVGLLAIPLLLVFHALMTLFAIYQTARGVAFRYPANITIIARSPKEPVS